MDIMRLFLVNTNHSDDTYDVYIKNLPKYIKGYFDKKDNALTIDESVVKEIYNGDLEAFICIFHELNHFRIKYEILDGVINLDVCRTLKEQLLRKESTDLFRETDSIKSFKGKCSYINDFYYNDNYRHYSGEVIADIRAKNDLVLLMSILLISYKMNDEISENACNKLLNDLISDDLVRYNNHTRDFTRNLNFNNYYLFFEDAFDVSVKYHPEWLEYPQISIEYYIDDDNSVKKRNIEELRILLSKSNSVETREYIQELINNLEKKQIDNDRRRIS